MLLRVLPRSSTIEVNDAISTRPAVTMTERIQRMAAISTIIGIPRTIQVPRVTKALISSIARRKV